MVLLCSPRSQTQHGGDVVFCRVVKINRHVAVQLQSSALPALLCQPHLLCDQRHGHDEQVATRPAHRRAAASPTDGSLSFAALLLHVVAAGRRGSWLKADSATM